MYKLFGILGFALGWTAISLLLFLWDTDKSKSISHNAASNKKAYIMMAVLETIGLPLFIIFVIKWMTPTLGLIPLFSILSVAIAVGLIVASWIPVTGPKGKIHDFCAYGAGLLFIPTTLILALSSGVSTPARIINIVACLGLSAVTALFLMGKTNQNHHLYYQTASILMFDIAILSAAYIR